MTRLNDLPDFDFNSHCQLLSYLSDEESTPSESQLTDLKRVEFEAIFLSELKDVVELGNNTRIDWLWSDDYNQQYVYAYLLIEEIHFYELAAMLKLCEFVNEEKAISTSYIIENIEGAQVQKTCNMISFRVPLPKELQNLNQSANN